jgi:hypothetical protein
MRFIVQVKHDILQGRFSTHRRTPKKQQPLENHGNSGKLLGKIKKIRADLSENMLNSGYSITILHKNSGKL